MTKWSHSPGLASSALRNAVAIVARSAAPCLVRANFSKAGRKARSKEPRGCGGLAARGAVGGGGGLKVDKCGRAAALRFASGLITTVEEFTEMSKLKLL